MTSYTCSFEQYGVCGFEQLSDDVTDWKVIRPRDRVSNRPALDHTLNSVNGYYAYVSTAMSTGSRALLQLPVKVPDSISCLTFQLSIATRGTFIVRKLSLLLLSFDPIYDCNFDLIVCSILGQLLSQF